MPGRRDGPDRVARVGRPLHVTAEESDDASELFDLERILVPLDFSPASDHALGIAIRLARTFQAELVLLHVCEVPAGLASPLPDGTASGQARLSEALHEGAERELAVRAERARQARLDPRTLVVTGTPAAAICDAARAHGADLVVMATRGRSGLAHVVVGSVTERTIHRAPCPVFTFRPPEDIGAGDGAAAGPGASP